MSLQIVKPKAIAKARRTCFSAMEMCAEFARHPAPALESEWRDLAVAFSRIGHLLDLQQDLFKQLMEARMPADTPAGEGNS